MVSVIWCLALWGYVMKFLFNRTMWTCILLLYFFMYIVSIASFLLSVVSIYELTSRPLTHWPATDIVNSRDSIHSYPTFARSTVSPRHPFTHMPYPFEGDKLHSSCKPATCNTPCLPFTAGRMRIQNSLHVLIPIITLTHVGDVAHRFE